MAWSDTIALLENECNAVAGHPVYEASTRLEWVVDSAYRFFPTLREETLGYVLHPVDLAMNKVTAAAGRREVCDLVDLVVIHDTILPLGAVIWAAVDKASEFTPEELIAEIRRKQIEAQYADQWVLVEETHWNKRGQP